MMVEVLLHLLICLEFGTHSHIPRQRDCPRKELSSTLIIQTQSLYETNTRPLSLDNATGEEDDPDYDW